VSTLDSLQLFCIFIHVERTPATTFEEHIKQMMDSIETMTQKQIDTCAWCMGGGGAQWTKERLRSELQRELDIKSSQPKYKEVMG
jgi:hypothetical protein